MEILTIVVGLLGLAIGVKILSRLNRVIRMLEQPIARKMPQEMKVRLGMRSQRDAKRTGDAGRPEGGQKNDNQRGERGDRQRNRDRDRNRNRDRNAPNTERSGGGNRDQQRRRNRFEAPSEVIGNGAETVETAPKGEVETSAPEPRREAPAAEQSHNGNRPPLAPRGGDRQAETVVAPAPSFVPEASAASASTDGVRFGRRTVVKRSPELEGDE